MTLPKETLWVRDPHTEAKHRVLAGYYAAWFPIMLQTFPRLTVFDGYAGPGEYLDGAEGSPIIALRSLLDRPQLVQRGRPVRFVFLEERDDRREHLAELIESKFPNRPGHVKVDVILGDCITDGEAALTAANAWGQPIFANLDPFGPAIPHELVVRLGRNRGSEVLVTFMSDWLRRFCALEDLEDGDLLFGSPGWRSVGSLSSPGDKELFLVSLYKTTLADAGLGLATEFKLSDEGGRTFYLIYGTGHRKGLQVMKDSMWKIDPVSGIQFRDPKDTEQGVLDLGQNEPDVAPLRRQLVTRLSEVGSMTLEDLREHTFFQTAFRSPHCTTAVKQLLAAETATRDPVGGQLSGKVRIALA
jgi:three-Cys-motif partner protein